MNQRKRLVREAVSLIADIWREARSVDIIKLYCNPNQIQTLGLATWLIACLRGKPLILRMAGGGKHHCDQGFFGGRIADFVVRHSDLFLLQTKRMVEACLREGVRKAVWYPTSRLLGDAIVPRPKCRRFAYVGQVRPIKGINEFLRAAETLPADAEAHVYGPLLDGIQADIFRSSRRVLYRGVLPHEQVLTVMRDYDAVVVPSKADSEGYPGVVLEALSLGLPVIASKVGGIPEIVDDNCGILIEPGNVEELGDAMHRLSIDRALYARLHQGALKAAGRFSAENWFDWLIDQCLRLRGPRS